MMTQMQSFCDGPQKELDGPKTIRINRNYNEEGIIIHKYTTKEPRTREQSILVYFFVNAQIWKEVKDSKAITKAETGSDRCLVRMQSAKLSNKEYKYGEEKIERKQ